MKKIILLSVSFLLMFGLAACNTAAAVNLPAEDTEEAEQAAQATTEAGDENASDSAATSEAQLAAPSLESLQAAYEGIYEKVLPSVVSIEVTTTLTQEDALLPELPFEFDLPQDEDQEEEQQEYRKSGEGSGFVWDTEGHIVTNNHVVEGADTIRVRFADGTSVLGDVIGADASSDLAVVKVDVPAARLQPIEMADSTQVKVGQLAVAIGNPFRLNSTMTTGIISALGRSLALDTSAEVTYTIPDVIQTDAAINPGNSGGVLVDINGRLIGVTTAIESPVRANSGVGYVIPSIIVRKIVPFLIEDGSYQQPYIGISGTDLTPEFAESMGLDSAQRGALIIDVNPGTPAEEAGLEGSDRTVEIDGVAQRVGGDVITSADGHSISDFEDLTAFLARYANVGQTIEISYLRDGQENKTSLTLAARPGEEETIIMREADNGAWLGVSGTDMNTAIAEAMSLNKSTRGVLVQQIESGSPADEAGLRGSYKPFDLDGEAILIGGDVITALDGEEISGMNSLIRALGEREPGDTIRLTILREGRQSQVSITLSEKP